MHCFLRLALVVILLGMFSGDLMGQKKLRTVRKPDCNADYRNRVAHSSGTMYAVETQPEFPGGNTALRCYLYDHMKSWSQADSIKMGQAAVGFELDTCGHVVNVSPADTLFPAFSAKLAEAVRSMPLWIPATVNLRPKPVHMQIGLRYPLEVFICK